MFALENLVANQNQNTSRIGQLFWYIIAETYTDQVTMARAFMESGLPDQYKLPPIRAVDAYRRASKSIEGRATLEGDRRIELLVRDVWHNRDEVVRHLVVEIRDTSGHRLTYDPKAALLRFDHNYKTVDVEIVRDEPFIVDAVTMFRRNFDLFLTTYDGAAKRRAVYAVLNDLAATALKESGGVYLIPRQNEELLFQLIAFINRLSGCKAYHLSVENTEEARDMVRDVVTNKAETILNEIRATLKADVVTEDTIQTLLERAKHIRQEVTLYQEILKESIGTLETDVDLLEQQMMSLVEKL
ncbi:MAG: hypothetical protein K6T81_15250 [Alicyclobacillus macrosporangiidus]|uniref:DUF6744 family protein n=1 Tax=Alicyclobacillus macrosporangiidus TaxID=392015 RepID=UPI0026F027C2|nr:DUF6744 family protein [Alicyclobacillus macrosporangiidus]MCL6600073.1 hypothetical protein [Alicyclobacillus macrosporangiidus]